MRVVIVDEDEEMSDLIKTSLWVAFYEKAKTLARSQQHLQEGLEIRQFSNQTEALGFLDNSEELIQLILVASSPVRGEKSFAAICQEKYRKKYGRMVVIAEQWAVDQDRREAPLDAQEYVVKPFVPEDLMPHLFKSWKD